MPREEMAQLATPSMAGILECAIGPVGAAIVNLGVILSLVGRAAGLCHHCVRDAVRGSAPGILPSGVCQDEQARRPGGNGSRELRHHAALLDRVVCGGEHLPVLL